MRAARSLAAAGALALAACVNGVGPDYHAPAKPGATAFTEAHPLLTLDPAPAHWWTLLHDPVLDDLVARTFAANPDLAAAAANVRAARAAYRVQQADLFPAVRGAAGYTHGRESGYARGLNQKLRDADLYDGSFDASWEVDIFGRVRRAVESARSQAEAVQAQYDDARVTLAAETVRAYVDLRGAQERLDVARRNAENQHRTYDLTVSLTEGGRGSQVDVVRARAQLETTLASISTFDAEANANRFRLAVLTGVAPDALADSITAAAALPVLPEQIAVGDVAAMLRRRPDIRAAERNLEAVTAQIGVATADLFPRVTLNGAIGLAAPSWGALSTPPAFQYSIGPSLSWSIFDFAHVRARIVQARAQADAQLARYQSTVLGALQDADTALTRFTRERERLAHLQASADASAEAAHLTEERYKAGIDNFLNVLDAQRNLLSVEDAVVQSRIALSEQFIAIHKALGAGWEPAAAPAVAQAAP